MKKLTRIKDGFTLMELMAVVAIVAILAGIGLGTYRRSMEKAILFEGLRNAHALAAAMDAYAAENGGYDFSSGIFGSTAVPDEVYSLLSKVESRGTRGVQWTKNFVYSISVEKLSTLGTGAGGFTLDEEGNQITTDGSNMEIMSVRADRKKGRDDKDYKYSLIVPLEHYKDQKMVQDICWVNGKHATHKEFYELCQSAGFVYCDTSNRCHKNPLIEGVDSRTGAPD